MPRVVYRESTEEGTDLEEVKVEEKIKDEGKVKDQEKEEQKGEVKKKTNVKGEQEMLNAMDLLVALKDKIIDEYVFVTLPRKALKRQFKEKGKISKFPKNDTLQVLIKQKKKGEIKKHFKESAEAFLKIECQP